MLPIMAIFWLLASCFTHTTAFRHKIIGSHVTLSPRHRMLKCRPVCAFRDDIRNVAIIAHVDHGEQVINFSFVFVPATM